MNILVTGGAGFIGSNIVNALLDKGHNVLVLDTFAREMTELKNKYVKNIKMDLLNNSISTVFREFSPEIVFHLAAQVSVQKSMKQPLLDANVNTLGTIAILEQCVKNKVQKIIYSSSAAVYGNPKYFGIDEKHSINPLSHYGISKYASELYVKLYSNLANLDYTILRYANVYGMRQEPYGEGGVVSIFINKILQDQSPVIFGNGNQTRDFIYVKDVVAANMAALTTGSKGVYNISCNAPISVNDLCGIVLKITNKKITPVYKAAKPGDIEHSYLDNRLAYKELCWKPEYNIYEGIKEIYDYYLENNVGSLSHAPF
ncbi:NAD-dependent epimerase/dehydratase family protein [Brevibacillus formosus]|uniref:NAD-dependent epimerase/dehydratase family protein n=1 Tax=Brevibacillus formosus TaxID=54913 RepID=UPI0018CD7E97|nr:NAD-dependent epimerase/dehydratase family protein [Brevibacillus formosus]MBG9941037.1 UDP-glucose 4-epimerase [Brevibacillus formosus]